MSVDYSKTVYVRQAIPGWKDPLVAEIANGEVLSHSALFFPIMEGHIDECIEWLQEIKRAIASTSGQTKVG